MVEVPSFTHTAIFGVQMKILSPNARAELRPAVRNPGLPPAVSCRLSGAQSGYVLCNIVSYLLSLEARHTLWAEGNKSVTKGEAAGATKPWIDRYKGQPRPSTEGIHRGCIMPGNRMWVLKTCLTKEGVSPDT